MSWIQNRLNMSSALGYKIKTFDSDSIREAKFMVRNKLKKIRESMLMSKAELAKQADVSPITITRIEKNMPCRMETQRKILLALGLKPVDKHKIFKD
jgi:DNA-binding XRE family transcriptional regulator